MWAGGTTELEGHRRHLREYAEREAKKEVNIYEHVDIKNLLKATGVACKKYNYSLDPQQRQHFDAVLKLSQDEKELIITNRRPTGLEKPDFSSLPTLGADAGVFQLADLKRAKQAVVDRCLVTFTEQKSNASCKIKDITGFLFGGFNSRFWAMRKHINSLSKRELQHNLPFFCWDCIAIETKARTVDLVIPDQELMNKLLKFLIYELRTSDGNTGSSEGILRAKLAGARAEC